MLSFDDEDENQYTNGLPLLKKYGFKATFFIMTVSIDKENYMTARQIVDEFFPGTGISPEWVTRNVPGRIKLGHRTVLWKRSAVEAWLAQLEAQP